MASSVSGTGLIGLADRHNFAVVAPQATKDVFGYPHFDINIGWAEGDPDDGNFIVDLLRQLQKDRGYSRDKSFVCGMSNGGFMTFNLAVEHSAVFQGFGNVVGTMAGYDWENRFTANPINLVSVIGL